MCGRLTRFYHSFQQFPRFPNSFSLIYFVCSLLLSLSRTHTHAHTRKNQTNNPYASSWLRICLTLVSIFFLTFFLNFSFSFSLLLVRLMMMRSFGNVSSHYFSMPSFASASLSSLLPLPSLSTKANVNAHTQHTNTYTHSSALFSPSFFLSCSTFSLCHGHFIIRY